MKVFVDKYQNHDIMIKRFYKIVLYNNLEVIMGRLKRLVVAAILFTMSTMVFAGGNQEKKGVLVGLALSDMSAPVFVQVQRRLTELVEADGNRLMVVDCKVNPSTLVNGIENMVSAGAKIIIVQNFAGDVGAAALQEAKNKGVVICSYDYFYDFAHYNSFADNTALGKVIGSETGKWITKTHGNNPVEVAMCDYPSMGFMVERANAMIEGLKTTAPNATVVVSQPAGFIPDGIVAGENIFQSHPNVKAVMGINDGGVLGVYQVFKSAGKSKKDGIGMFGSDGSSDAAAAIKEQDMFVCTIDLKLIKMFTDLYKRALYTVQNGGKLLENERIAYFAMDPIYYQNVSEIE
jgi:ribose transport system substrate-binding protein